MATIRKSWSVTGVGGTFEGTIVIWEINKINQPQLDGPSDVTRTMYHVKSYVNNIQYKESTVISKFELFRLLPDMEAELQTVVTTRANIASVPNVGPWLNGRGYTVVP